ncbi:MAG: pantetheine-phosphate adenylyltransferase [Treponema sp.]|nr:pantetheine-phosphate adenylyltransferase [Treponema sp.]
MLNAIFPGSFDPATLGHINIIERAASVFAKLVVVVADNPSKGCLFSPDERKTMLEEIVKPWSNVSVVVWDRLVVDFMKERGIRILIRGVRGINDFSYEFELSLMNKALSPQIETIFMTTDPRYFVLRSSAIKELASFRGDVSAMVPPIVAEALAKKFQGG